MKLNRTHGIVIGARAEHKLVGDFTACQTISVEVRVFVSDVSMWLNGTVLFSSPEGAVFDAAVIQLNNKYKFLKNPEWKIATLKEGVFISLYIMDFPIIQF